MRLLFITEFFPYNDKLEFSGGVESHNYHLIRELAKRHQVMVICRKSSEQKEQIKNPNIRIIRLGWNPKRIDTTVLTVPARLLFLIQSLIEGLKLDFDLVQGNNFVSYIQAYMIGLLKRKPTIAWYPDVFIGDWTRLTGIFSGMFGEIVEQISLKLPWTHFIALSESTKNKLLNQGIKNERISTIYGGVDLDYFIPSRVRKKKVFTITCISRLVSYKNIDLLIKAAAILKNDRIPVWVNIVGEGPMRSSLQKLIKDLELTAQVKIESKLSWQKLNERLKSSHLFCLPSSQEGFGLVVIEAAASGIPYVVSDLTVLKEITRNGLGGMFFKGGSAPDLAKKIKKFISDRSLQERLSSQALELAHFYSWERIAQEFEVEYQRIVKKKIYVVMLIDAWFPHMGGGQIHTWELSKQLTQMGCSVTIVTRNLGVYLDNQPNIKVIRLGKAREFENIFGRGEYLVKAFFVTLFLKHDIVHAHAFSPGLLVPILRLFRRSKYVFTVHGKGQKIAGLGIGGKWLEELVVYSIRYDLEISVAKKTLIKPVAADKLLVIPNGVEIEKFALARRTRNSVKTIGYVGRLSFEKGVDLLIRSFRSLPNSRQLRLLIVGVGSEMMNLKKIAKGATISFLGKKIDRELVVELKKMDLLVLPSRSEGQPLTLFEAWAAKVPILVTNVGDNGRYIKHSRNGFIVSEADLTKGLLEVLSSKNLPKIIERAYLDVQKFSWNRVGEKTFRAYEEMLK